jgi:hypothetical protein
MTWILTFMKGLLTWGSLAMKIVSDFIMTRILLKLLDVH